MTYEIETVNFSGPWPMQSYVLARDGHVPGETIAICLGEHHCQNAERIAWFFNTYGDGREPTPPTVPES